MDYDMGGFDIPRAKVDALIKAGERYGMTVGEDWNEPEGARFIGTFEGTHVTLYPKFDPHFALYFTVAHLYGHMVQAARADEPGSERGERAAALVASSPKLLTHEEAQCIYDHEREAAAIGRKLIAELGPVSAEEDRQYMRLFLADFHYLIHFVESGDKGTELFARYLRREPVPYETLAPDPRPLVDLRDAKKVMHKVTVV
jgi:hypothetical protein